MHTAPPHNRSTSSDTNIDVRVGPADMPSTAASNNRIPTTSGGSAPLSRSTRTMAHRSRSRRAARRWTGMFIRVGAVLALVGGLVVLPVLMWRLIGGPAAIDWRRLLDQGRVDADTVVAIGLVVFSLMWAWFALTAVAEVLRVIAWRREPAATLPPIDPTPSGAIRRLVRAALVSTSTVVVASLSSLGGGTGVAAAAAAVVMEQAVCPVIAGETVAMSRANGAATASPNSLRSSGRETPYSVAARLGDPSLRDRIIELNHGALAPDGSVWTGGVFPAGMDVAVPVGSLGDEQVNWQPYSVRDGDSVYRIATRLAEGDHRRVRDVADRIIERNLGRVMGDGKVFDDPSLIRIGWVIEVPAASTNADGAGPAAPEVIGHLVQPGESYWSIAAQHIDDPTDAPAVAALTDELIDRNALRLGHPIGQMLHPGDVVELSDRVTPAVGDLGTDTVLVTPTQPVPGPVDDSAAQPDPAGDGDPGSAPAASVVTAPAPDTPAPAGHEADPPRATNANDDAIDDVIDNANDHSIDNAIDNAIDNSTEATNANVLEDETDDSTVVLVADGGPTDDAGVLGGSADATSSATGTPPATSVAVDDTRRTSAPVTTSLAAAVLVCAGALGLADSRRRMQLRRAGVHARVPVPTARAQRVERVVRSLDATQRAVRLDLALRSAGHLLVGTGGYVLAVIVGSDGQVTLLLDRPGRVPSAPWVTDNITDRADRWVLPAEIDDDQLAPTARLAGQPCPAVVHLGRVASDAGYPGDGELYVDLEAFGLVCLDAPHTDGGGADAVLRAIATSLATSPVGETLRLITHEVDTAVHLGNLNAEAADDIDAALDLAASALGSTPTAIGHKRTSELRARGTGGEAWEPVVVVSGAGQLPPTALRELRDVTRGGGRGLAVVLRQPVEGASQTVRAAAHGWEIERLGLTVVPVGLDLQHVNDVRHLIFSAEQPLLETAITAPLPCTETPFVEPEWSLLVRVLGGIDVVDLTGSAVPFDRGKSLELTAWLALHREQSTRGGARAALWESDVRDATFANIVSDARRSLAKAVMPPEGEEWIARTLTDHLPLHARVRTDAELLRARLEHSRGRQPVDAIEVLRPGVALIREQPFAGTDYLWPDTEGTTSALIQLCTAASTELARHHLALGDIDGVFWATGQGLKALRGHEELIGLRMRAHAQCGDRAGVRQEWDAYERALLADDWSDCEPSPKLLALRKQLLQQ